MRKKRFHVYQSRGHLFLTGVLVFLPFLFLLLFSQHAIVAREKLAADVLYSVIRLGIAYAIAATLGWISAAFFSRGAVSKVAIPLFDVLQSFPNFAALPIAAKLFGANDFIIIFFLVFTIVWPIFFTIVSSLKLVRSEWQEAVEMSHLSGVDYIRYFLWPVSIPGLITGSIIGLGEAWEALVATEIIVKAPIGIGDFLQRYTNNPTVTLFGMCGFLVVIFVINKLIWLPLLEWSHQNLEE